MEVPVLKGMIDLDGGVYRTLSVTDTVDVSRWAPLLILAIAASIATIVNAVKVFIVKFGSVEPLSCSEQPLLEHDSDADTASDSDDDEEYEEETEDDDVTDFRVRGSDQWQFRNLRDGDFADLGAGKSVVKLWDNAGSGFDGYDSGADFPAYSPQVVVSASGENCSRSVGVRVWDRRVSCRVPAILAEWRVDEVAVGDVRKANAPLGSVAGWDSDDVTERDYVFDALEGECYESAVTRCCDAVRSHLL